MTAFMIVVTGALLGLLILIDPSPRNLRTLKIGAFVGVLSLLAAWTWPIQVGMGLIALFLLVPSLASAVGLLVPVGALIAIGVARILYKKNLL